MNAQGLHQLFEDQVFKTPNKIAVESEHLSLSYDALNKSANRLAHHIASITSTDQHSFVSVLLERDASILIAVLAVLKSGRCYLPITPELPEERIHAILDDSQSRVILTTKALWLSKKISTDARVIFLDALENNFLHESENNLNLPFSENNLAYVIYTSGSTGKPKGVLITHRNVTGFLSAIQAEITLNPSDRWLAISAFTFDISILELFLPVIVGGCCVIADTWTCKDPKKIIQVIREKNITAIQATPGMWFLITEEIETWDLTKPLKILCGGERLSRSLAEKLLTRVSAFWNVYGPTETTIWSTLYCVKKGFLSDIVPIGKPLKNTVYQILDSDKNPVAVGEVGELFIGGDGVAQGYLNREALTQDKFSVRDYQKKPTRFYQTGDWVKVGVDHNLEYVGRIDDQVKIGGYRIELSEIESVLLKAKNVARVCVVCDSDLFNPLLVAFVIGNEKKENDVDKLFAFLAQHLPNYMLPNKILFREQFPLTVHGKVDKKQLINDAKNSVSSAVINYPVTDTEIELSHIWSLILKINISQISRDSHFLHIGGHSLLAAQLTNRIQTQFQIRLSLREIFEDPILHKMASLLDRKINMAPAHQKPTCSAAEHGRFADSFLKNHEPTPIESSLWFFQKMESQTTFLNLSCAFDLKGDIDFSLIEQTIERLVKRHPALRTRFEFKDNAVIRITCSYQKNMIPVHSIPCDDVDYELILKEIKATHEAPFNLEIDFPFRVCVYRLNDNRMTLMMTCHHIISDEWSIELLKREFCDVYNEKIDFQCEASDIKRTQHSVDHHKIEYWKNVLGDLTPIDFPFDFKRPEVATHDGERYFISIPSELKKRVMHFLHSHQTTLFITLYSVFSLLLARYSGENDTVIGVPVANRNNEAEEHAIGCFIDMIALRSHFNDKLSFCDFISQNQKIFFEALDNKTVSLNQIINALDIKQEQNRHPVFQIVFSLQNVPKTPFHLEGITSRTIPVQVKSVQFDLSLILSENNNDIEGYIAFNTQLLKRESIEVLWGNYLRLLEVCCSDSVTPILKLPYLSQSSLNKIIHTWGQGKRIDYPKKTLSQLFETTVLQFPHHSALSYEKIALTYQSLNEKANQYATYLKSSYFIQPNQVIAVVFPRGIEMIVAILAILKTGAAYLPIDPVNPKERILFQLEDSRAHAILTNAAIFNTLFAESEFDDRCVIFDNIDTTVEKLSPENTHSDCVSSDLAYVIYTSGSTGKPKGVMIAHQGVVNTILSQISIFQITPQSRVIQLASIGFDSSVSEMFRTLLSGATLVLNPPEKIVPGEILSQTLLEQHISVMTIPPAALRLLPKINYPALKTMASAGEACGIDLLRLWARDYRFINAYGPTEISICATTAVLNADEKNHVPIGRPLSNVSVYVLDSHLNLLPEQCVGELYVGGAGVSRGYINQSDLTQSRFIQNPFSDNPNDRLYKTGDRVAWHEDGQLLFFGRSDDQVKIRGFRVELVEVEKIIQNDVAIDHTVVLSADINFNTLLIAYVVAKNNQLLDINLLRQRLSKQLPQYMMPNHFVVLDNIPMTVNRKVDKKKLLAMPLDAAHYSNDYRYPSNALEFSLVKLWESVLQVSPIGIHDHFNALGGHSLLMVKLMMAMENHFQKKLPIKLIIENPTIAQLSKSIAWHLSDTSVSEQTRVPLHENTEKPILYFVHETTGQAYCYLPMAEALSKTHSVYGLQDLDQPLESIELTAKRYIEDILKEHESDDYHLAGWCMGAVIAYEMAQQLSALGKRVTLKMIDPAIPNANRKIVSAAEELEKIRQALITEGLLEVNSKSLMAENIYHRILLTRRYHPKKFAHEVMIFLPEEILPDTMHSNDEKVVAWSEWISKIRVFKTPGNHFSMIKMPHALTLAEVIRSRCEI